jgi:hypothetical protein
MLSSTSRFEMKPASVVRQTVSVSPLFVPAISNLFIHRLVVSLLITGADASIVLIYAPYVFSGAVNMPILRAAFTVLILGLTASLARMWYLTFKAFM